MYWFCHISTWIRHRYTCVPHPEPSSLLPEKVADFKCPYHAFAAIGFLLLDIVHSQWCWWSIFQHPSLRGPEGQVPTSIGRAWISIMYVLGQLWGIRISFCANRWELFPIYCSGEFRSRSVMVDKSSLDNTGNSSSRTGFDRMWDSEG